MLKVKDIMTRDIITIPQDMSVQEICATLLKHKLGGLPVINKKEDLVGFVSERDIIASVRLKNFLNRKAKDVMTKKVFSLREDMSAEGASKIFADKPFHYVPVMRRSKIVGVVSRKDIINSLLGQYY